MAVDQRLRILLIGSNGQIGWELARTLLPFGNITAPDSSQLDLLNVADIRRWIGGVKPQIIVNAAAYTAVDKAEEEPEIAKIINGIAPGILGEEAKKIGAAVMHFSTDYVFNGEKRAPYTETDPTNPINTYGETKLAGELALQSSGAVHIILRTSWVFGLRGRNFLLTILRLIKERQRLTIVNDQTGAPTWSRMIAEAAAYIIAKKGRTLDEVAGIYHLTCQGQTTWYEFARQISTLHPDCQSAVADIQPIPSERYVTAARRPQYSILSNDKLMNTFGILLPDWRDALAVAIRR
jgi:dTDP-4-dehydrorhamnose reductase